MQRRVALLILGAFYTSLSSGIEAITGLISIHLHLQKLNDRFHLRVHTLPSNHIIKSLLEIRHMNDKEAHWLSLERLTPRQWLNIKGLIIDMNNRFNKIVPFFSLFSCEFFLGNRLINIFPSHFSFHFSNRKSKESLETHLCNLNNMTFQASTNPQSVVIVSDASIKNQIATLIAHVHNHDNLVIKMIYHVINVISTKVELFIIRCGIKQTTYLSNIS